MSSSTLRRRTAIRRSSMPSSSSNNETGASERDSRRWDQLDENLLLKIFQTFDANEVASGTAPIGHICSNWRRVARDPILWNTVDLTMLRSLYTEIHVRPFVYVPFRSDQSLFRILKVSLSLSRGHIRTLIFHHLCYVKEDQLVYTARRCPHLRRLVLPSWNRISKYGVRKAIRGWPELESLTLCHSLNSIPNPQHLMTEIHRNCQSFSELKVMGYCDVELAALIVTYMPNLRVVSLRCSYLVKEALILLLDWLRSLERLNIAHCCLVDIPAPPAPPQVLDHIDDSILQRASGLREFVTCTDVGSCVMCQRTRADEGIFRWERYEEDCWKVDELGSLAV